MRVVCVSVCDERDNAQILYKHICVRFDACHCAFIPESARDTRLAHLPSCVNWIFSSASVFVCMCVGFCGVQLERYVPDVFAVQIHFWLSWKWIYVCECVFASFKHTFALVLSISANATAATAAMVDFTECTLMSPQWQWCGASPPPQPFQGCGFQLSSLPSQRRKVSACLVSVSIFPTSATILYTAHANRYVTSHTAAKS